MVSPGCRFGEMSRLPLLRRLAVCACLMAGISIPSSDLLHGIAHHEAAHHHDAVGGNGVAAVTAWEHAGDHPHPTIGRALTVRLDGAHAAAIPPQVPVLVEHNVRQQPRIRVAENARRRASRQARPPSTRAPPIA